MVYLKKNLLKLLYHLLSYPNKSKQLIFKVLILDLSPVQSYIYFLENLKQVVIFYSSLVHIQTWVDRKKQGALILNGEYW